MGLSFRTGQTIYEVVYSVDLNNNTVVPVTFDIDVYRNGSVYTGATVSVSLQDASSGAYASSWSASTEGDYQVYYKNDVTSVIYITDTYQVRPDSEFEAVKVFVGV